MFARTFKTVAIAAAIVVATASASFAASAYVDHSTKVKAQPSKNSQSVNWVEEGQKVQIVAYSGNWVKVKIPGKDGWVKENTLDYNYAPYPVYDNYGPDYGGSVCLGDKNASFCINANY